jgi:hypothetical protein
MKVHVLKNKAGKIIATFEPTATSDIKLEPQIPKGHKVEEVEVASDYVSRLDTIYKKKPARKKKTK